MQSGGKVRERGWESKVSLTRKVVWFRMGVSIIHSFIGPLSSRTLSEVWFFKVDIDTPAKRQIDRQSVRQADRQKDIDKKTNRHGQTDNRQQTDQ